MSQLKRSISLILLTIAIPFILVALLVFTASAASRQPDEAADQAQSFIDSGSTNRAAETAAAIDKPAQVQILAAGQTTLALFILSTPNVIFDFNDADGPNAFVVQALVSNTGNTTATNVTIHLDYNEEPLNNWVLLSGENPDRKVTEIAPGAGVHNYWFATYPTSTSDVDFFHTYTVSAQADNTNLVSTSDNYYGNPSPGVTVQAEHSLSTGNNRTLQSISDIALGSPFTVSVDYNIGQGADALIFSPVGNTDFVPGAYRMFASSVRLLNDAGTWEQIYTDQLYIPSVPADADKAEARFYFIALDAVNTRLCTYMAVDSTQNIKYDGNYCDIDLGTVIVISGSSDISITKQASDLQVQQDELLTYTIDYANNGSLAANLVWIWDDVDTSMVDILTPTITPAADSNESSASRVAWNIGTILPAANDTLTFATIVDGNGQDLADGALIVNNAFFGINDGVVPSIPGLTRTFTTTIVAPTIDISKSDGHTNAVRGQELTYTLKITNSGSITATGIVVTDVLPANVSYVPGAANEDNLDGRTLTWLTLNDIAPGGGQLEIQIPVTVDSDVPDGTILTNDATVKYENMAGYVYDSKTATDTTTISAPMLAISKIESSDPIFAGTNLTYTLSYSNSGASASANTVITDRVPLNTTYQDCSGGLTCGLSGDIVSWTLAPVSGGSNGTVNFSVLVSESLNTGTVLRNEDYGIAADNHDFVAGELVTTTVTKEEAIFDGYAFEDDNSNGVKDVGEPGLVNVTVTLPSAVQPVQMTDAQGYYRFRVESQGAISVSSELPTGFIRTTPATVYSNAVFGVTKTVDFGYTGLVSFASIYGTVFTDANGNGVQEAGELGIPGVTVTLDSGIEAVTNIYGNYTLSTTNPAVHTVTETDPPNHFSTTPNNVNVNVAMGSSYEVNFGDAPDGSGFGVIMGTVFEDENGNGQMDGTELGISGVSVSLDGANTTATNAYGNYGFASAVTGPHQVTETDLPGYFSTMPNEVHLTLSLNQAHVVNFGDALESEAGFLAFYGTVFEDSNLDGQWGATERGIAGVTVSLDGVNSVTTNIYGSFSLSSTADGSHTVIETDPPGYLSTTPNSVTKNDTEIGAGYQVDYGDIADCTVDSYEEDDGAAQANDLGASQVQSHNFCDDSHDWQKFSAKAGNTYTITTQSWGQRADTFLTLFDTDASTQLAANDDYDGASDFSSRIVWQAQASGTYFIRTTNRAGLSGLVTDYDIGLVEEVENYLFFPVFYNQAGGQTRAVERSQLANRPIPRVVQEFHETWSWLLGDIDHACADIYEIDDTWQEAKPIVLGNVQIHSFDSDPQRYAADKDFVSFDMPANSTITFNIPTVTNTQTLMEIYDDQGAALGVFGSNELVWSNPTSGRYYLSVSPPPTADNFGCIDEVGYELSAEMVTAPTYYFPIFFNN